MVNQKNGICTSIFWQRYILVTCLQKDKMDRSKWKNVEYVNAREEEISLKYKT